SQLIRIEPEDAMAHAIAYIGRGLSGVLIEDSMHDFIGDFKKAITLYPDIEEIFQYHLESPNHNLLIIDILRQGFIESTLVRIIKQFCDYKETKLAVHQ
ncbi:hypothetical protein, partial [Cylindrospermopsis raciborskii]|uniref:hypothetical protein n=1 Tax=Cylindrospermopsis raciborskii TaxID=77022 RepID=UPI0022C6F5CC